MAMFRVITTELTTYEVCVEAETEDEAVDKVFDGGLRGEEVAHDFQIEKVEEV